MVLSRGARFITLLDAHGESLDTGWVTPGDYRIRAVFGAGRPVSAGTLTVRSGETLYIACSATTASCSVR